MNRLICPPKSEHHKLRQPLQEGERLVLEFFDRWLPEEWEIYLQPHLNGLRPDFVLLHPRLGIGVFEIKDWDLDRMERWVETRPNRAPVLVGRDRGVPSRCRTRTRSTRYTVTSRKFSTCTAPD